MSDLYLTLKLIHILGSAVLFGTGLGIAFFMWMAHRSRDAATIAATARIVVIADALFTVAAVILLPVSGAGMALLVGFSLFHWWIVATIVLYVLVGLCWLPAVWIQIRLRNLAAAASRDGTPLPERYHQLFRVWFWLGWPAFTGVIAIFMLMIWKPA